MNDSGSSATVSGQSLVDELGVDGSAAPPRSNGEFVFEAPWESRAFGMTLALAEDGVFSMSDFQQELIVAVAEWDALNEPADNYRYYECWLKALERLVDRRSSVTISDVDQLAGEYVQRPAGHDHDHDHDHGGEHHHH